MVKEKKKKMREGTNKTILAAKMGKSTDTVEMKSAVKAESWFCHLSVWFVILSLNLF